MDENTRWKLNILHARLLRHSRKIQKFLQFSSPFNCNTMFAIEVFSDSARFKVISCDPALKFADI